MAFSLATFNVRDLFDAAHLARAGVVSAERVHRARLDAIARTIRRLDADVIALQEVQSAAVLDDVRARLPPTSGYGPAIAATADARGIACGMLTRLPVIATREHQCADIRFPVFVQGDPQPFASRLAARRAMLEVTLALPDGSPMTVIVVHLKSGLPTPMTGVDGARRSIGDQRTLIESNVRSLIARVGEALFVREIVDDRLRAAPRAQLAVAGDFNDVAESHAVRAVSGDLAFDARAELDGVVRGGDVASYVERALHACADSIPLERRYSVVYRSRPQQLDHILVTSALWERFRSAAFLNENLREITAALGDAGDAALESDHAPLRAEFA